VEGDRAEGSIELWLGEDSKDCIVRRVSFEDGREGRIKMDEDWSGRESIFKESKSGMCIG